MKFKERSPMDRLSHLARCSAAKAVAEVSVGVDSPNKKPGIITRGLDAASDSVDKIDTALQNFPGFPKGSLFGRLRGLEVPAPQAKDDVIYS